MTTQSQVYATKKNSKLYVYAGLIGNILEHYDTALFGLLAPFIAPLFFPTLQPINALIATYAILPLEILSRPVGSIIFGQIGDRLGRKQALSISITGTALMTGLIGCIPVYADIGVLAPIVLACARFIQKFFAAGETVGGAIFVLEHHENGNKGFIGSLYSCSTVLGILLASALITTFDTFKIIETHWRWLFFIGFATSAIGLYIRLNTNESPEFIEQSHINTHSLFKTINTYRRQFLAIIAASGFSYATYVVAFIFLNGYLPIISKISSQEVMSINTWLLGLDMLLLPLFGWIADKKSAASQMFLASGIVFVTAIPIFLLCDQASYFQIVLIRAFWVVLGVWFCAPFHAWSQYLVPVRYRYTVISLGYSIGAQLIGAPMAAASFWIYKKTGLVYAPAFYLMATALIAMIAVRGKKAETQVAT